MNYSERLRQLNGAILRNNSTEKSEKVSRQYLWKNSLFTESWDKISSNPDSTEHFLIKPDSTKVISQETFSLRKIYLKWYSQLTDVFLLFTLKRRFNMLEQCQVLSLAKILFLTFFFLILNYLCSTPKKYK